MSDTHESMFREILTAASRLIGAEDTVEALHGAFTVIGRALDIDGIFLFDHPAHATKDVSPLQGYSGWKSERISDELYEEILQEFRAQTGIPARWALFISKGDLLHGCVDEFPQQEQIFCRRYCINSILLLPIPIKDQYRGCIAFLNCREGLTWSVEIRSALIDFTLCLGAALDSFSLRDPLHLFYDDSKAIRASDRDLRIQKIIWEKFIDAAPEAIVILDPQKHVLSVNKEFTRIFGYTYNEVRNQSINELIVPESLRDEAVKIHDEVLKGHTVSEEAIRRRKDCTLLDVSILVRPIVVDSNQTAILAIYRDISKEKRQEKLNHAIYQISEIASESTNMEEAFAAIHGIVTSLMPAKNLRIALIDTESGEVTYPYIVSEKHAACSQGCVGQLFLERVLATGKMVFADYSLIQKLNKGNDPAREIHLKQWVGVPLRIGEKIIGTLAVPNYDENVRYSQEDLDVLHFVSSQIAMTIERKRAQEALEISQERLGQLVNQKNLLLSILAHDLRGPFTATIGYSELLAREENLPPDLVREYGEIIYQSVHRQLTLATRLLEWARLDSGQTPFQPKTIDIASAILSIVEMMRVLAEKKFILLSTSVNSGLKAYADEGLFVQVITNLLSNAIKFTQEGGTINITASRDHDSVSIVVRDTGVGISPDDLKNILSFDKLHTTKGTQGEPGSGLGLSICMKIIDLHNGQFFIESEKGKGTIITVTLPTNSSIHPKSKSHNQ